MTIFMKCPLCNSEDVKSIFKKMSHSISSDSNFVNAEVSNSICLLCGHVFNTTGTRNKTLEFYTDSYKLMNSSTEAEFKYYSKFESISFSDWRLNYLLENASIHTNGSILDIGCGKANFLKAFSKKFSQWKLYGIEASKNALDFAKQKLPNAQFYDGLFVKNPFDKKFDLIVSLGVVEHLEDPNTFLQNISNCLTDDGILFIDIPNFKLNPADLYVFDHLGHFTKETLQNLLHYNGFKIIKILQKFDRVPLFVICRKNTHKIELKNFSTLLKKIIVGHIEFNESILKTYEDTNQKFDKIGIFGLGIMAWVGIQNKKLDKNKIINFFDENDLLIGKEKHGIHIKSLNDLINFKDLPIVFSLSPCYIPYVIKKLDQINIKYVLPLNYTYFKNFI